MAKATKPTSSATPPLPTDADVHDADSRDRIAMRAYELYLARGGFDGQDFDDWLTAERELSVPNDKGMDE